MTKRRRINPGPRLPMPEVKVATVVTELPEKRGEEPIALAVAEVVTDLPRTRRGPSYDRWTAIRPTLPKEGEGWARLELAPDEVRRISSTRGVAGQCGVLLVQRAKSIFAQQKEPDAP